MTRSAVAIGGGHGAARTLRALRRVVGQVTAIVTVADDGGSSGRLRRDLGVVPPGDLRMALTALARNDELARLVDHRFEHGELAGHSLGNLMLVGLLEQRGHDVVAALDAMGRQLALAGRILPCTPEPVTLHAQTASGVVDGQATIAATTGIEKVWIEPAGAAATDGAAEAIIGADVVVLGPGSLFTSVLPNLLVAGVADAVRAARGPIVMVANLREQLGETQGLTLVDHLDAMQQHVGDVRIDVLVVHDGAPPSGEGRPLRIDREALAQRVGRIVGAPLSDGADGHDPDALARVLAEIIGG